MTRITSRIVAILAAAWAMGLPGGICLGQAGPKLNEGVDAATTIIIGRLDQYIAEPEALDRMVEEQSHSSRVMTGNPAAIVRRTIQPRGTYVFTVLSTLRGHPPQPLMVRLPRVTVQGYSSPFADPESDVPLKGTYLLLLSGTEATGFSPTTTAPIRLSDKAPLPREAIDERQPGAGVTEVVWLLADSLLDSVTRDGAAYMLSNARSAEALKVLRPYADDPDDNVRTFAIECMASNQDLAAIPKIAAWKYSNPGTSGNPVNGALRKYTMAAAIPVLNPLIVEPRDQYTRLNALMALRQIPPDKTSIPYLMKALHDPENREVPYIAYSCLHKLLPELGPAKNTAQFAQTAEEEIKALEGWWADEQAGKH